MIRMRGNSPSGRGAPPGDEEKVHGYQIGKTIDEIKWDRIYSLYGQEVERELMARNREQFGFRVIDSTRLMALLKLTRPLSPKVGQKPDTKPVG